MDRTSAPGNINRQFTNGDPQTGTPATVVDETIMNSLQNELTEIVEDAGLTPDSSDYQQIRQALMRVMVSNNMLFNASFISNERANVSTVANGSEEQISDGWYAECAGPTINTVSFAPSGYGYGMKITGVTPLAGVINLRQSFVANRRLPHMENMNTDPTNHFTSAVRFGTFAAEDSVPFSVQMLQTNWSEDVLDITRDDFVNGGAGGNAEDIQALAVSRFSTVNKSGGHYNDRMYGPSIKIAFQATGSFSLYLYGCGVWHGTIQNAYIPETIVGNYMVDEAFVRTIGVSSQSLYQKEVVCPVLGPNVGGTTSFVYLTARWETPLQNSPQTSDVILTIENSNSRTISNNAGVTDSKTWTNVSAKTIVNVDKYGFTAFIGAEHDACAGDEAIAMVTFSASVSI